jgi:hypothetical protein
MLCLGVNIKHITAEQWSFKELAHIHYVYIYTMASNGTDLNLNLVAKQKQGWKMTHW